MSTKKLLKMRQDEAAHFNAEMAHKGESGRLINTRTNRVEGAPGGAEEPRMPAIEVSAKRKKR